LNIAALPPDLPAELIADILRGGAETAKQAGVVIAGGHTVQDKEPKYGLVVLGIADPLHMLTKHGARPGDALVLTKPLGFGTTTTALKRDQADPEDVRDVVDWMKRLNRTASEIAVACGLRGGTDVTGYSLLGHAWEMASASGVKFRFHFDRIPFTRGAQRYASEWIFPGGASDNRLYYSPRVQFAGQIDEASQMLLFDPQTSGGLLLAVPPEALFWFRSRAAQEGLPCWEVGEVLDGEDIEVVP
jgi:selenide,water dikinase